MQMEKNLNSPARVRLTALFDEGSYKEIGSCVMEKNAPAGVVCAYGYVNGNPVYAFAQDQSVEKGAVGAAQAEKIAKVYVGNVQLTDENDFAISNDGKTVTLSPSFLNKRTAGSTYTIKVLTKNGEYASTTFQILTTAQASASPRTGDTSNIGLWTAVLMLSAGAGVAILPRLKKEQ
jgi:hypothetical protein